MKKGSLTVIGLVILIVTSCAQVDNKKEKDKMNNTNLKTAIFGGGCFWCTEAIFQDVNGVLSVESGYAGGEDENPTYEEVCTGLTGHAEVINIKYNADVVSYSDLLYIFFKTHNPTTLNRQGADQGTQYRSVVFYMNEEEKKIAEKMIKELDVLNIWNDPIVTEVTAYTNYFPAEKGHQDYYSNNQLKPYCQVVISPKLEKFKKEFKEKLK